MVTNNLKLITLLLLMVSCFSWADVTARIDRFEMYSDETLQLNIRVTPNGEINQSDLASLQALFNIVQRGQYSNTTITNGKRTAETTYQFALQPKQTGILTIPAFRSGNDTSEPLQVTVYEAKQRPDTLPEDAVILSARLSKNDPYISEPFTLTIEVAFKIQMQNATLQGIELDNFESEQIDSGQTIATRNGQQYNIYQQVIKLTPNEAGLFEVPEVVFTAAYTNPSTRRSERFTRTAKLPTIQVKKIPSDYPAGAYWLPAKSLTLVDDLDSSKTYSQGDYIDWLTLMTVDGIEANRLPDPLQNFESQLTGGVRIYRNAAELDETKRIDPSALSFTEAGTVTLPAVRIPWWNTQKDALEWAEIPQRTLNVAASTATAANPATASPAVQTPTPQPETAPPSISPQLTTEQSGNGLWQALTALFFVLWVGTLAYLLKIKKGNQPNTVAAAQTKPNAAAFSFKKAISEKAYGSYYHELLKLMNEKSISRTALASDELDSLGKLENFLFNGNDSAPDDKALLALAKSAQKSSVAKSNKPALSSLSVMFGE
ncbi:BatD family protein [Reinekea marinisedimentorum]|uniref:Oxygen tolerance protein BatD n=1 Tax=Reinekea marinisedimentorum TaxID=230495 RepID=A0A4R3I447_9GAMM|nr:BatD family protein [Reinekea marinisedimentorum]TCS40646.1 oxygen tolerance protein BatD [Reinekea marinisedimentorum]